jgi:hypothetical protein
MGDESVSLGRFARDLAVARVHDEDFGGLGAAINADYESAHN